VTWRLNGKFSGGSDLRLSPMGFLIFPQIYLNKADVEVETNLRIDFVDDFECSWISLKLPLLKSRGMKQ
jgi:hypothetical protein